MIDQHLKLFESLNKKKVEYLLIGGMLSIAYGVPRVTKDIDLFVRGNLDNASLCLEALTDCGLGTALLTTAQEVCNTEITIFKDVVRVDVLTKVKGLEFDQAWANKFSLHIDGTPILCLSLDDLIKSKKAAGRPRDEEDIKILEQAKSKKV